ncbi:amidohydrolase family protein [Desulfopila inferna]|uniref:amidohydrolase family protein n=1 Tax=Desulfopila inferna TaxID=468528 RepID=UPI001966191A|nr:amidohydrolase family protein [Desulfopila inferna]MBM9603955.1 amidohydrolase [Desulfopila inferna]
MLQPNMPIINDQEGSEVAADLPAIVDAHVHIFPDTIFSAIWKWFDENAWKIRYRLNSPQIFDYLLSRGVHHIIALQYAHKPGIARQLNSYMSEQCRAYVDRVTGMATVYPGEKDAGRVLQEAFDIGLGGLKLHAHVQCFEVNSDQMYILYECCSTNRKPLIMHIGREPKSTAYNCDPYQLCRAEGLERVLKDFPELRICVPHLGFDEVAEYKRLIEKFDNLWLDTTMVINDYFPIKEKIELGRYRPERIMYGSDFPNIPYAWDRELKVLQETDITADALEKITWRNAVEFFDLKESLFYENL